MTTGNTNLFDLASSLLGAVVTVFANAGVALPSEQYVTAVLPVAMCDTVAVTWEGIHPGWPGTPPAPVAKNKASTRMAVLWVYIFRCLQAVPGGTGQAMDVSPSVTQFQSDAAQIMTDAFVLFRGLQQANYMQPPWWGDFTTAIALGPALPVAAEGGMGGVQMSLTVELT